MHSASMSLNELSVASLGGDGQTMEPAMRLALEADFGGLDGWRAQFADSAKRSGDGSGWMLLLFSPREGALVNHWAADATHLLAGGSPLLALDLHEHGRHPDIGANIGANIAARVDARLSAIDWAGVHERYKTAVLAGSEGMAVDPGDIAHSLVLDVRRAGVFQQATTQLPGAVWRDPATVKQWTVHLPQDRPVVVYCVHGHEVSRATALRLRGSGVDARYLQGGIEGWRTAGFPVAPTETDAHITLVDRQEDGAHKTACASRFPFPAPRPAVRARWRST